MTPGATCAGRQTSKKKKLQRDRDPRATISRRIPGSPKKAVATMKFVFARVLNAALALAALFSVSGPAHSNEPKSDESRLEAALARLEAQIPLTAADHTALKKAALARKLPGLRVCGDPGNLPLSDINREGYQNKIIELLTKEMGTYVTYFWRPYLERGITRQTFETGDCDVLLDLPIGFERVLTSEPIYKTTYVLAYRNDKGLDLSGLDDPKLKDLTIGTFQTSGGRQALARRGIRTNVKLHVLSHNSDLDPENQPWKQVEQMVEGKLDVVVVWGPFAGWVQKVKGAPISIKPINLEEHEIPLEFEVGIGLRKIDWVLKYKFDLALEARKTEIEKILRDYGVPLVQCSRCMVAGDLQAHGVYEKPAETSSDNAPVAIAPDQKVTRQRLEAWLNDGADIDQELSNAVLAGDLARMAFLIEKGADVNKLDQQGYAALHIAARHRRAELISALLAYKADINVRDRDGFTPLHHAVLRNHPESIKALASRGAEIEARTSTGFTPLALAIIEDQFKSAYALIEVGAPVDTPVGEAQLTPLMLTAGKEGRLLSLGAGTTRVEKWNPKDPGQLEVARALIDKGAKVNAVSNSGLTALLLAAAHNNAPIVGLLAEAGANLAAKTPGGKTASELARDNGNAAVVSLITLLSQARPN